MTNEQKWQLATEAAELLVSSYHVPGVELRAEFGAGFGQGTTDSTFRREGTSTTSRTYALPAAISALLENAPETSGVSSEVGGAESDLIIRLLQQLATSLPGVSALQEAEGIDPTVYQGVNSLLSMSARNPYSSDYESAVGSLYDRMFEKGRSLAQSGPANVRGGQARTGFELGELDAEVGRQKFRDVRQQQDREAGVVQNAVNIMNTIEGLRRGSKLQAQQQHVGGEHVRNTESLGAADTLARRRAANLGQLTTAGEFLGVPTSRVRDNLRGKGSQATQQWNVGLGMSGCCFIFLEVLNGELPEYVRRGRDEYNTPNRRAGYVWMSSWLVPVMKRWGWTKWLVNNIMVKPFLRWGATLYDGRSPLPLLKQYCWGWFWLWSMLGVIYGKQQR